MTHQILTLPAWTPIASDNTSSASSTTTTTTSANTVNNTATTATEAQKTKYGVTNGDWLRFIYGRVSVAPVIPTIVKHPSGDLLLLCVFAANPCRAIGNLYVGDDKQSQVARYTGNQTAPDAWLSEAISDYNDVLSGITYAVLRIKDDADVPRMSNIRAIVEGQPIPAGWENPAQCMAHFATTYMGLTVEPTGLAATAARCDEIINDERRRTLSLVMSNRTSKGDWLATLAEYAGCYYSIKNGVLRMIAKKPRGVSHTITPDKIVADSVTLSRVSLLSVANRLNVTYSKPGELAEAWSSEVASVTLPDIAAVDWRESNINMSGFSSASMATRYGIERLNAQNLCDLKISFETPVTAGEDIEIGEVIAVTSGIGLSAKQFVVLSNDKSDIGKNKITGIEYDAAVFSDEIVVEPSTSDTNLPSPTDVGKVSNLTASELLKKNNTGIWHSYLQISFDGAASHVLYDVEVYDKDNLSQTVWQAYGIKIDDIITSPVTELRTYVVKVRGSNLFQFAGDWASVEVETNGKLEPPTNVKKIKGEELAGVVYLNWTLSKDIDLRDYLIQRMPVGAAWDSQFAVDVNTVTALRDAVADVPVGRWDFCVKARDWAGNLSKKEARCTVVVDNEGAADKGDIHDFDTLGKSNMSEIYQGFFDDHDEKQYITTPQAFSAFSQPLKNYTKPLASYNNGNSRVWTPVYDFGLVINGSWTGYNNVIDLDGNSTSILKVAKSAGDWEISTLSNKTQGRWAKLETGTTGAMLVTLPLWQVRAVARQRTEVGKGMSSASGNVRVNLSNKYYDYINLMIQPIGFGLTGGVEGIHITPTGDNYINVFVINQNGARVAKPFTYTFTGR